MGCEGDQTNSEPKVSTIISYTEKAEQLNRVRPDVHAAAFHVCFHFLINLSDQ